jgi:hypothetical protein
MRAGKKIEKTMRSWGEANSREWPNVESVLILGLTDGVLLIRYFSFSTRDVEGATGIQIWTRPSEMLGKGMVSTRLHGRPCPTRKMNFTN